MLSSDQLEQQQQRANLLMQQIQAQQQLQLQQAQAQAQAQAQQQTRAQGRRSKAHSPEREEEPAAHPDHADPLSVLLGAVMSEVEAREEEERQPIDPPPEGKYTMFHAALEGGRFCYVPQRPRTKTLAPSSDAKPEPAPKEEEEEGGNPDTPPNAAPPAARAELPARRPASDWTRLATWAENLRKEEAMQEHEVAEALFDLARRVEEPVPIRRTGPVTRGGRERTDPPVYPRDRAERRTPVQYSALDAGTLDDDDDYDYQQDLPARKPAGGRGAGRGSAPSAPAVGAKRRGGRGGRMLEPARKITKKGQEENNAYATQQQAVAQALQHPSLAGRTLVQGPLSHQGLPQYYLANLPAGWGAPQGDEAGPGPSSLLQQMAQQHQHQQQMIAAAAAQVSSQQHRARPQPRKSALHAHIAQFIQWHQASSKAQGNPPREDLLVMNTSRSRNVTAAAPQTAAAAPEENGAAAAAETAAAVVPAVQNQNQIPEENQAAAAVELQAEEAKPQQGQPPSPQALPPQQQQMTQEDQQRALMFALQHQAQQQPNQHLQLLAQMQQAQAQALQQQQQVQQLLALRGINLGGVNVQGLQQQLLGGVLGGNPSGLSGGAFLQALQLSALQSQQAANAGRMAMMNQQQAQQQQVQQGRPGMANGQVQVQVPQQQLNFPNVMMQGGMFPQPNAGQPQGQ